jgi:folate-binding protein YgfZ
MIEEKTKRMLPYEKASLPDFFCASSYDKRKMINNGQNMCPRGETLSPGQTLLPAWGLIFVEGPDAAQFLQNQLTNSVLGLRRTFSPQVAKSASSVRFVGYCSPKGRLLASAWLALMPVDESAHDRFVLFISKDIAASTAKRLSMYVLRSKVTVTDVSNEWSVFGTFNANPQNDASVNDGQIGLEIPSVQYGDQTFKRLLIAQKNTENQSDVHDQALTTWNDLEVLSAIPRIVLATQEQFVPQMINFESVGGVDFKKGCYPGQEIVARSQYRGVIKRRLCLGHTTAEDIGALLPGAEIFHSDDVSQPAGMVVLSAVSSVEPNRVDLQVECKLEALNSGEIHLGSSQGPVLKLDPLPYPLIDI